MSDHAPAAGNSPGTQGPHTSGAPSYAAPPQYPPAGYAPPVAMTGFVTLGNGQVQTLASPGKRLGARLIDMVLLIVAATVIGTLGFGSTAALGSLGTDVAAASALGTFFATLLTILAVAIAYEVTLTAIRGQTVGKMAVGIRVVRADNGAVPGWGKSIIRWALPNLMCLIPLVGWIGGLLTYVSLTWDDSRQGWHDKAGATVVVS